MIFDRFAFLYVDHRVPIFWKIIESQGIGVGQKIVLDFWKKIFVTHIQLIFLKTLEVFLGATQNLNLR